MVLPFLVQQNKILEGKIQRSPSRVANVKKADSSNGTLAPPSSVIPPSSSSSAIPPSTLLSNSIFPGSYNSSGPQIFLRIRIQDTADAAHLYTTISVYVLSVYFVLAEAFVPLIDSTNSSATMYMQEALEMVCRRRRLQAKEYALLLSDMSILIPLDRTVASLQGESDLRLVKRSMLPHMNVDARPIGRSTDPNGTSLSLPPCRHDEITFSLTCRRCHLASIFKRMSDVPDLDYNTSQDFTAAYKVGTLGLASPPLSLAHPHRRNTPFTERCR